jgi:hypothetical protein
MAPGADSDPLGEPGYLGGEPVTGEKAAEQEADIGFIGKVTQEFYHLCLSLHMGDEHIPSPM